MSGVPAGWCRSTAQRFPSGAVVSDVRWVEHVPADADSAAGLAWRERELGRPLRPDAGPDPRTVLLCYRDGPADLVTVEWLGPAPERASAPDWGLGDGLDGPMVCCPVELTVAQPFTDQLAVLVGALGLVLARYTGQHRIRLGWYPAQALIVTIDPALTVAGYLTTVTDAMARPEVDDRPEELLAGLPGTAMPHWPPEPGSVRRPFLSPPYPLSFAVQSDSAELWYLPGEIAPAVAERFARCLSTVARELADPQQPLAELLIFDQPALRELAELGGLGLQPKPDFELIHQAVRARAADQPDAIAVCAGEQRLSYRELDQRSDRVAGALTARGIGPGSRVGVCLDRSAELIVLLLGVLKAGACYLPLDPTWPEQRRAFVAADAELALLIDDSTGPLNLKSSDQMSDSIVDGGDIAYVIYTSGSTGQPKGVPVPHRNVCQLLAATADRFGLGRSDVWTQFHSSAFDFSVWEIWGCLMTGGRLVIVPYRTSRMPEEFAALLAAEQVSVLNQTPSAFGQLLEVDRDAPLPASLRLIIFGGEPLDPRSLLDWFDRHPERSCQLVNMYGITETTVHVTAQPIGRAEALAGTRSVGRPLPGWQLTVADQHGRPVPPGVAGEIYVGGVGVAGSYLNRPELTAARFQPDPFTGGLRYRTGDLGRLLPDGRLEHLGRVDNQVQLHGHRVELGEVRARLLDAPGVRSAAVLFRHDPADPLSARLDGYVVGEVDPEQVRRHAASFLPDYMVPATVTRLPALPLTSNGKVDEGRLPAPGRSDDSDPAVRADIPDRTSEPDSVAGTVQTTWQDVFGFQVGLDDDFFALGGNSLIAVRLLAALHAAGLPRLAVAQLYRNRTVNRLTAALTQTATKGRHD
ncbi:MAG TPA: amino acid adenylation domain-containing protein [Jatrophihabitans sp.]|nr:amino acid adenylation domain-containing protein [Jatrophihabitans sp.]